MDIQPIHPQPINTHPIASTPEAGQDGKTFTQALQESIGKVNDLQNQADEAINGLMAGKSSLHETLIALEKADMSFQVMMQIRNKIISAYEEIVRMQL